MPAEDRDLQRAVLTGIRSVDQVFTRLAAEITAIIRTLPTGPLSASERRILRHELDDPLRRVFGLTRRAAITSELFTTILGATDAAAEGPFVRAVTRVRQIVDRTDPAWWGRIQRRKPNDPFIRIVTALDGPDVARQRLFRAGLLDPQRRWVDSDGYRLSDRVWQQGQHVRRQIDTRIVEAISRGEDAISLARDLEQYLNPDKAPTRYLANGKIVRRNMTKAPRGGYGSSSARRLARTEITRVFGAASVKAHQHTPGVPGMRWRTSGSHPGPRDICDLNATNHSAGMGPGQYTFAELPPYPGHANCLCTIAPIVASREDVLDELVRRFGD